eukprot:CAMPEP_0185779442 /NCGR_PEP_ID=MMETSP1174-20130828/95831_1 /TAXON_ID=35687 /ORGANISM="Dictyocha speculum, Strain CCMP1381" /LENGTH=119 /DNA_ID=CAMNT_0028468607 /DNA_START=163 /DNA_END=522 /DNA_ORIENTATION=-
MTLIEGYNEKGFIVNDQILKGSVVCFSRLSLLWTPRKFEDIDVTSLCLLPLIQPSIEMLVLGTGEELRRPPAELVKFLNKSGIAIEQMRTIHALETFNVLNQEDRRVAAALLHPSADWD